jgi:hypothetical protein
MSGKDLNLACAATPFRPSELLLADQRSILIEQPDLIAPTGDGSLVTIYRRPHTIEVVDLVPVVSIRFSVPGRFDDSVLEP